jgi:hypothetical protein
MCANVLLHCNANMAKNSVDSLGLPGLVAAYHEATRLQVTGS